MNPLKQLNGMPPLNSIDHVVYTECTEDMINNGIRNEALKTLMTIDVFQRQKQVRAIELTPP